MHRIPVHRIALARQPDFYYKFRKITRGGPDAVEAGLGGARVAFIIGILNRAVLSVYSKPELKQPADLRGKILGVTLPGSTTDLTARILLTQMGLTPGKDVQVTHLQGMPDIITALVQGRIDAGIVSAPTTVKLRQAGLKGALCFNGRDADHTEFCDQSSRQDGETGTIHRQLVRGRIGEVRLH